MSKKVVKLVQKRPAPNPHCVEFLKKALTKARRGEIQIVFIVGQDFEGGSVSGWSKGDTRVFSMLGAIEEAKMRYAAKEIEK